MDYMPDISYMITESIRKRFDNETNMWLSTVRPDGRPHLVPVWFVYWKGKLFINIESKSVKSRNIENNKKVSMSLENGTLHSVVICEGQANLIDTPVPDQVIESFRKKYDWDIVDDGNDQTWEIRPKKWLTW